MWSVNVKAPYVRSRAGQPVMQSSRDLPPNRSIDPLVDYSREEETVWWKVLGINIFDRTNSLW